MRCEMRKSLVVRGAAFVTLLVALSLLCFVTAMKSHALADGITDVESSRADVEAELSNGWREETDGWHYREDGDDLRGWHELPSRDNPEVIARYHFNDLTGAMDTRSLIYDGEDGARFVEEDGKMASGKEVYDPTSDAWYWADSVEVNDGRIAMGKDVYLPSNGGKWVRYDDEGKMVKGQDYAISPDDSQWHWWYFDFETGAMQKGFVYVPEDEKWCYYDTVNGWMLYGEQCLVSDADNQLHWYYFDPYTGAMDYEWAYIPTSGKWVYYDKTMGWMLYGSHMIGDRPYYLDPQTGERISHDEVVARLLAVAASQDGQTSGDEYEAMLASVGVERNPNGPCMTYVWWCFHEAGMDLQFMDGQATSWPHEAALWYEASGRLMHGDPQPGDIWLIYQDGAGPAPATHAGLIASHPYYIDGEKYVDVWEFVNGWVHLQRENCIWYEGHLYGGSITGFGRPYYND